MPRHTGQQDRENLHNRLYQRDLERWSDWLRQQERLRALLPKAIDVLEDTLDAGGPEAVPLALALVKLANVSAPVEKPQGILLGLAEPDELRARLAAHDRHDERPALTSGEN